MTQNAILLALAILPVIVLGTFVYRKDKFEKEPFRLLLKAFFLGCLSCLPAIFLEIILQHLYSSFWGDALPGAIKGAYTGFIVAGCSEELCKLMFLKWAVWRSRDFNEYFDGIVYATFVSLGFAGLENLMYVFSQDNYTAAIMTGSIRALLSVPGHFLFGVVMGYYFALAKFDPSNKKSHLFKAFFYPMLLHGTFDSLLMIPEAMGEDGAWLSTILFIAFIYFDIRMWKVAMRRLRHLQQLSETQQEQMNDDSNSQWHNDNNQSYNDGQNNQQGGNDPFSGFNWNV